MADTIIIKPTIQWQFDRCMDRERVLFFSAPCGFGKATLAGALLRGQDVLRLSADDLLFGHDEVQHYHFWPQFHAFLVREMEREYTEERRKALFSRGGLYYELKEDCAHALE